MTVQVRARHDNDLPVLGQVLVRVHAVDGYPVEGVNDPIGWLTPPHQLTAWTALDHDRPVGHVALAQATTEDETAQVWRDYTGGSLERLAIPARLFVDPDYRNHGFGGMLMRTVQDHAREHKLALAFDVMLKDRTAIRLYEEAGCIRIGTITHHHSQGQVAQAAIYAVPPTQDNQALMRQ